MSAKKYSIELDSVERGTVDRKPKVYFSEHSTDVFFQLRQISSRNTRVKDSTAELLLCAGQKLDSPVSEELICPEGHQTLLQRLQEQEKCEYYHLEEVPSWQPTDFVPRLHILKPDSLESKEFIELIENEKESHFRNYALGLMAENGFGEYCAQNIEEAQSEYLTGSKEHYDHACAMKMMSFHCEPSPLNNFSPDKKYSKALEHFVQALIHSGLFDVASSKQSSQLLVSYFYVLLDSVPEFKKYVSGGVKNVVEMAEEKMGLLLKGMSVLEKSPRHVEGVILLFLVHLKMDSKLMANLWNQLYLLARESTNPTICFLVGELLDVGYFGISHRHDYEKRLQLYSHAAEKNHQVAKQRLGSIYDAMFQMSLFKQGVNEELQGIYAKAYQMHRETENRNHPSGLLFLGMHHFDGNEAILDSSRELDEEEEKEKAIRYFRKLYLLGDKGNLMNFFRLLKSQKIKCYGVALRIKEENIRFNEIPMGYCFEKGIEVGKSVYMALFSYKDLLMKFFDQKEYDKIAYVSYRIGTLLKNNGFERHAEDYYKLCFFTNLNLIKENPLNKGTLYDLAKVLQKTSSKQNQNGKFALELIELIYNLPSENFYQKIVSVSCGKKLKRPKKTFTDLGSSMMNRSSSMNRSDSASAEEKRGMFKSMQSEIFESALNSRAKLQEMKKKIEEKLAEISNLVSKNDKASLKRILGNQSLKFSIEDNIESLLNNMMENGESPAVISISSKKKRRSTQNTKRLTTPLSIALASPEDEQSQTLTESSVDSFLAKVQSLCPSLHVWDKEEIEVGPKVVQHDHGGLYSATLYEGSIKSNGQSVGIIGYPLTNLKQLETYPELIKEWGTLFHPNFVVYLGVAVEYDLEKNSYMLLLIRDSKTQSIRSFIEGDSKDKMTPHFVLNVFEGLLEACKSFHLTGQSLRWLNLDTVFVGVDGRPIVFLPFLEPFFSSRVSFLQSFETKDKKVNDKIIFFAPEVLKRDSEKTISLESKEDMKFFWSFECKQDFWSVAMLLLFLVGGNNLIKWKKLGNNGELMNFMEKKKMNKKIKLSEREKELLNKNIGKKFKKILKKSIVQKESDRPKMKEIRKELRNAQKNLGIDKNKVKSSKILEDVSASFITTGRSGGDSVVLDHLFLPGGIKLSEKYQLVNGPRGFVLDLRKEDTVSVIVNGQMGKIKREEGVLDWKKLKIKEIEVENTNHLEKEKKMIRIEAGQPPLRSFLKELLEVLSQFMDKDQNAPVNMALKGAKPFDKHFPQGPRANEGFWQMTTHQIYEELKDALEFDQKGLSKAVDPWGGQLLFKKQDLKDSSILQGNFKRVYGFLRHLPLMTLFRKFKGTEESLRIDISPFMLKVNVPNHHAKKEAKSFYDFVERTSVPSENPKHQQLFCVFSEGHLGRGYFTPNYQLNQGILFLDNTTFFSVDGGHEGGENTLYKMATREKYVGSFKKMRPHGNCHYYREDRKLIDGYFSQGVPHGKAFVYNEKKTLVFRGTVLNGFPLHGILIKDEQQYEGMFVTSETKPQGGLVEQVVNADLFFEGLVKNFQPNILFLMGGFDMKSPVFEGMLRIWYTDNSKYLGHFTNGSRSGIGLYEMNTGSQFIGKWSQKVLDGYIRWYPNHPTLQISEGRFFSDEKGSLNLSPGGRLIFKNGDQYVGETIRNKAHGCGVLITSTEKYTGEFENGIRQGYALVESQNWMFEGSYEHDKKNGLGWLTDKTEGKELIAFFEDDEMLIKVLNDPPINLRYIIEPGNIAYLEGTLNDFKTRMPKDAHVVVIGSPKKQGKFWIVLKEEGARTPQYLINLDKGVPSYAGKVGENFQYHGEVIRILPNERYIYETYAHGMLMEACI